MHTFLEHWYHQQSLYVPLHILGNTKTTTTTLPSSYTYYPSFSNCSACTPYHTFQIYLTLTPPHHLNVEDMLVCYNDLVKPILTDAAKP